MREIRVQLLQKVYSFWGTPSPRTPTGAPPLDPTGGLPSPRLPDFAPPPFQTSFRRHWYECLYVCFNPAKRQWTYMCEITVNNFATTFDTADHSSYRWPQPSRSVQLYYAFIRLMNWTIPLSVHVLVGWRHIVSTVIKVIFSSFTNRRIADHCMMLYKVIIYRIADFIWL